VGGGGKKDKERKRGASIPTGRLTGDGEKMMGKKRSQGSNRGHQLATDGTQLFNKGLACLRGKGDGSKTQKTRKGEEIGVGVG